MYLVDNLCCQWALQATVDGLAKLSDKHRQSEVEVLYIYTGMVFEGLPFACYMFDP